MKTESTNFRTLKETKSKFGTCSNSGTGKKLFENNNNDYYIEVGKLKWALFNEGIDEKHPTGKAYLRKNLSSIETDLWKIPTKEDIRMFFKHVYDIIDDEMNIRMYVDKRTGNMIEAMIVDRYRSFYDRGSRDFLISRIRLVRR